MIMNNVSFDHVQVMQQIVELKKAGKTDLDFSIDIE